jgi:DNA-binding CsgD family transcriptional regulator
MRCLSLPARTTPSAIPHDLCPLIEAVGTAQFPRLLLASVEHMLEAPNAALYEFGGHGTRMVFGRFTARDTQERHTREYAGRYASADPARLAAVPGRVVTTCMQSSELPDPGHRALLEARGFTSRIVTVFHGSFTLNVLRPTGTGISDAMLERFSRAAPAYGSLIARHFGASLEARLRERCPGLTPRESSVCESLLRGRSAPEVAVALGIGVSSVQTYRKRAYAKLGVSSLPELFQHLL